MTVTYGFYDSLNGDRKYNAAQMSRLFQGIISDGVMASVGGGFAVTNNNGSMNINVASGRAWFKSTWTYNDATIVLTPDASDPVLHRIDSVIIEVNTDINTRANTIKILKGTPGSSPVAPTLTNNATLGQYPLANIYVGAGVTAITQANITNRIGTTDCPLASALVPAFDFSLLEQQYIAQFNAWFTDLQNNLDTNQATNLQNQINSLESEQDGWQPLGATPVYVSKDDATGVINVPIDLTAKINSGMRLRYEQDQALTAYWNLDANSNSQVGSFNGTDTAVTYTAGKFGNAATFNGTTSKIAIADNASLRPTGEFTLGAWFKTSVTGVPQTIFSSFYYTGSGYLGYNMQIGADNKMSFTNYKNGSGTTPDKDYFSISSTSNVCDGNWHYAVVTFRNNYLQLYIDGKLEGARYAQGPAYHASNAIRIGALYFSGDQYFLSGQIDDVFMINGYALDERTILNKYRANTAQGTANITIKKHALITNVGAYSGGNTQVTFWGGNDFSLANATIANAYYSNVSKPFGFNANPNKWTVFQYDYTSRPQTDPGANTWYNIGGVSITIPIGIWSVSYKAKTYKSVPSSASAYIQAALSTTNNGATDSEFITGFGAYASLSIDTTLTTTKTLTLASKTTYYMNAMTAVGGAGHAIYFLDDQLAMVIKAICSYL